MAKSMPRSSRSTRSADAETEPRAGDQAAHDLGRATTDRLAERLSPQILKRSAPDQCLRRGEVHRSPSDPLGELAAGQLVAGGFDPPGPPGPHRTPPPPSPPPDTTHSP